MRQILNNTEQLFPFFGVSLASEEAIFLNLFVWLIDQC